MAQDGHGSKLSSTVGAEAEAERSVLGAALHGGRPAVDEVLAAGLRSQDFGAARLRTVWGVIEALHERNDRIDLMTVVDELQTRGQLDGVGGAAGLSGLEAWTVSDAAIGRHASIIVNGANYRRLAEAAYVIGSAANAREDTPAQLLAEAQDVFMNLNRRAADDLGIVNRPQTVADVLARAGQAPEGSLPTGFQDLDGMLRGGLRPGSLYVLAARPAMGKAQPLDALVLTPSGFVPMGSLSVGDEVMSPTGESQRISAITPQGVKECFVVRMSDGATTRCSADHLWFTRTRNEHRTGSTGSVKTTAEIKETLHIEKGTRQNHTLPLTVPLEFTPRGERPLDPYLLGLLLGDGCLTKGTTSFCKPEPDLWRRLKEALPEGDATSPIRCGVRIRREHRSNSSSETMRILRELGLAGCSSLEKFIPDPYLYAPVDQRRELLAGLLDTDGCVVVPGGRSIEFTSSSERLFDGVAFLIRSLGGIASTAEPRIPTYTARDGHKLEGAPSWRMVLWFPDGTVPVTSEKHLARWTGGESFYGRRIESIEPAEPCEMQCIAVTGPSRLYVTDDFIITHNSALGHQIGANIADQGVPVALFSMEMTGEELIEREIAGKSQRSVDSWRGRDAQSRAVGAGGFVADRCLTLIDKSGLDLPGLLSRIRRVVRRDGVSLVIVDYIQLIGGSARWSKSDNKSSEVGEISSALKVCAQDLRIPIIALSQLNREVEKRPGKRPQLSDLRDSGSIEQDANVVIFLHRPEYYLGDQCPEDRRGVCEVIIGKNRSGATGAIDLYFDGPTTSFREQREMSLR